MQTRASEAVAATVAASSSPNRSSAVRKLAAITPSPKRSKTSGRLIDFSPETKTTDIREEMKSLVLSNINIDGGAKSSDSKIDTTTIGGWCLIDGLSHCGEASNGMLLPLIREHGIPNFYLAHLQNQNSTSFGDYNPSVSNNSDGYQSFRSLCRIVSGQQLAGSAASIIWRRLLSVADATEDDTTNLTPERILAIVLNGNVESDLRAPAGLSNAKCNCIIAIANAFQDGILSDGILLGGEATDEVVRELLLGIKGLGPWSVDMLLLFQVHKSDIMPIGDLAFRNGTQKLWGIKNGKAKGGGLCQKKDKHVMEKCHQPFSPYRSISSYYMYKCSGMKG